MTEQGKVVKKFFKKFGIPQNWVNDEGDFVVNDGESGVDDARINEGEWSNIGADEIHVDGDTIEFKFTRQPSNDKEWVKAKMRADGGNVERLAKMIEEGEDHAHGWR